MENNTQSTVDSRFVKELQYFVHISFTSEEEMKALYLQMSKIVNPQLQYVELDESIKLKNLFRKLRQYINCLQFIGDHEWNAGIAEILNASGVYMLQNNVELKKRLKNNEAIGMHLQFMTQLAGNIHLIKQIQGIINYHRGNVEYLLKK